MIAVRIVPERIPITGFENIISIRAKDGESLSPSIEPDMVSIPNISTAKPIIIVPMFFFLSDAAAIVITTPTAARTGVNEDGFNRRIKKLSPLIPVVESSHAVTVVPTFAPMIILIVCPSFIMPELTKPTSITVVADEL